MKSASSKIFVFLGNKKLQVAISFLISGLLAAGFFTWLTHLSLFEDFFFVPDHKFGHTARFSWWLAVSLFFTIGLIVGFLFSLRKINFIRKFQLTFGRAFVSFALIVSTMPFTTWFSLTYLELLGNWLGIIIPFLLIVPFSSAMCIVTRDFRKILIAVPITTIVFIIVALIVRASHHLLLDIDHIDARKIYTLEFVEWAVSYSILSLYFGLWLIWREKRN